MRVLNPSVASCCSSSNVALTEVHVAPRLGEGIARDGTGLNYKSISKLAIQSEQYTQSNGSLIKYTVRETGEC